MAWIDVGNGYFNETGDGISIGAGTWLPYGAESEAIIAASGGFSRPYDQMQSLPANLETAGLPTSGPFVSALETAFAQAGSPGYGGQTAFDLISNADINKVNTDPLGYANQLLQQAGIPGFASTQEWMEANTALPGHNEPLRAFDPGTVAEGLWEGARSYASNEGALLPLLGAAAGAAGLYGAGAGAAEGVGAAGAGATAEGAGFTGGFTGTAAGAPGFTGAAAGSPGLAATLGATGTSLAPGFFAGESLLPAIGGLGAATGAAGLGAASSGASGGAGGAAGGALVDGVMTDGATSGGEAGLGAGTALSRLLGLSSNNADLLSLLGIAGATGLGVYGANQQSDALRDISGQQLAAERERYADLTRREQERFDVLSAREAEQRSDAIRREQERFGLLQGREDAAIAGQRGDIEFGRSVGAPYRQRLSDLMANPNSFLTSPEVTAPVQQGTDALARALSVQGNPFGSGTALQEIQNYSANQLFGRLGEEKNRLGTLGGIPSYGTAGASIPGLGSSLPGSVPMFGAPFAGNSGAGANVGTSGGSQALMGSVGSQADIYNTLGYGLSELTRPRRRSLADYFGLT